MGVSSNRYATRIFRDRVAARRRSLAAANTAFSTFWWENSGGRSGVTGAIGVNVERPGSAFNNFFGDHHLFDPFKTRQIEHGVKQNAFHDRPQAAGPGLAFDGLARDSAECLLGEAEIDALHLEKPLVLFDQGVLWFEQNALECRLVEV